LASSGTSAATTVPDTAGITNAFAVAAAGPKPETPVVEAGPKPAAPSVEATLKPAVPSVEAGQVFRGLFQDTDQAAPLAGAVSELWGVPSTAPRATASATPPPASPLMLNLFRDSDDRS
jgi:hypothetical protein